jgi:class 3 adenylate cyclase/tetratricopeptide (TPR) repeat protein
MICPECQFDSREGAKFCKKCGAKLVLICPQCSTLNTPDSLFCDECGFDLLKPDKAPTVNYSEPQSYTPKHLADKILTSRSSIEGARKLVTILFADVANYTSISEKLDPEEVHQIMDGCFKILMDEIHKNEGTINQFTGDGVMALFGAPVAHEDHAQRACYTALSIQKATGEYGEKIEKDTGVEFKLRIGLNSGPVIVGSIGNDLRMDYTAVGDTTNLGSRMESMARPGTTLVSGNTHKLARDFFKFKPIGKVKVKGKKKPQEAYELLKTGVVETRFKASVAKGLTKFVGRKNSMPALKEPYDKARAGSGQIIGVVGEAGVGKSRLLLEFVNQLPPNDVTYLEGKCLQYGSSIIYMPFLEILKSYFNIKEEDREYIINKKIKEKAFALDEKLVSIIPPIQSLLSLKVVDKNYLALEPAQKREKNFEALRDLLIRASQEKPLILAVEDLHWIDKTSEEFLEYLIGWIANARIMLILLYRPEYTHQWGSKSYYTKIGLTQLGSASSRKLVQAILEEGDIAPDLEQLVLDRGGGNPLFMEELTYNLLENGTIQKKDRKYILNPKASDVQVPDTIQGIVAARMDRLEENLKRTMQVASVIGREFAFRILQTITGMREEIKSYLFNLQGLEFIYEKSLFPELEYIFKHALTQEVAYNSLLLARRKEIHEKIGRAIEELYPHRLKEFYEILAHHYSKSDNREKAFRYLKLSGKKAMGNYSPREALRFYKKAVDTTNQQGETPKNKKKKLDVFILMIDPMAFLGFPEDSFDVLKEAEVLSKELGDEKKLAGIYRILSLYYSMKGDPLLGVKYTEDCFREAKKIQKLDLMAKSAFVLCQAYGWSGNYLKIVDMAPSVITLIEKTGKESESFNYPFNLYSYFCAYYGFSLGFIGNMKKGEIFCEKGLRYAVKIRDLMAMGMCEMLTGLFWMTKGDGKPCLEHFQNSINYFEEATFPFALGLCWGGQGCGYYFIGNLEAAKMYLEKGLHIHKNESGVDAQLSFYYWSLSLNHFDQGDLKKAQDHAEKALKLSLNNNERHHEGISKTLLGLALGKKDPSQYNKAEKYILDGIKILEELKLKPFLSLSYLFLGELYSYSDQREKALEYLKKAEENFYDMEMGYWLDKTREALEKL